MHELKHSFGFGGNFGPQIHYLSYKISINLTSRWLASIYFLNLVNRCDTPSIKIIISITWIQPFWFHSDLICYIDCIISRILATQVRPWFRGISVNPPPKKNKNLQSWMIFVCLIGGGREGLTEIHGKPGCKKVLSFLCNMSIVKIFKIAWIKQSCLVWWQPWTSKLIYFYKVNRFDATTVIINIFFKLIQ